MSAPQKVCILCGEDCSSRPRVKDAQGRYSCKACHAAALEEATRRAPQPAAFEPEPEFQMTTACPSCGTPTAGTLCRACGYDSNISRAPKVAVTREGPRVGAVAGAVAGAAASKIFSTGNPIAWLIAGAIGGAIGAAIWAGVAAATNYEIGWIAWGIGALVGIGVRVGTGDNPSALSGVVAAVIAIASVGAGKYFAVSMVIDSAIKESDVTTSFTDEEAQVRIAYEIAFEMEEAGKTLKWPGDEEEVAESLDDFPAEVKAATLDRWSRGGPDWQAQYKAAAEAQAQADFEELTSMFKKEGFSASFTPFDLLWFGLAICTAFSIGAGVAGGGDD